MLTAGGDENRGTTGDRGSRVHPIVGIAARGLVDEGPVYRARHPSPGTAFNPGQLDIDPPHALSDRLQSAHPPGRSARLRSGFRPGHSSVSP